MRYASLLKTLDYYRETAEMEEKEMEKIAKLGKTPQVNKIIISHCIDPHPPHSYFFYYSIFFYLHIL